MRVQRSLMIAAAVCVIAGILFGSALARALSTETVEPAPVQRVVPTEAAVPAHETPPGPATRTAPAGVQHDARRAASELDIDAIMLAVENDPFRPERQRPSERYRLPGEEIAEEAPPSQPQAPPAPPFRVLATAVTPAGGIALVQVQESVNRVINVGETVFGYKLANVGAGTATLEGSAGAITLRVDEPQATRPRNTRSTRAQPASGRGNVPARELDARAAQMRDAIERLRANGGNPQQIERLMEVMGRELEQLRRGQGVEVQRSPGGANQIIIRPRADTMMSNRN